MKKVIILDIDGVITDTGSQKDVIIEKVIQGHGILEKPGVRELLGRGINRVIIAQNIQELYGIDQSTLLQEINTSLHELERNPPIVDDVMNFVKENQDSFLFFTNTSMPRQVMRENFQKFGITQYFEELFAYEDGTKKENIEHIMREYDLQKKDVLFVDDKQTHIDHVLPLGIYTLLYKIREIKLSDEVGKIFG